ncbi:phosphate ABC transporter, permease protein PstA [Candidatus Magnetoovum chiemensis]|nr:phosphate ABC transporter, permease protein PstA [Candidatus Magnetoovum chiemensis]
MTRIKKFCQSGEHFIWLTGGALFISLFLVIGLLILIMSKGLISFWPFSAAMITLKDGSKILGQETGTEIIPQQELNNKNEPLYRTQYKIGNRDIYGLDFKWIDDRNVSAIEYPKEAVVIERREWGNLYGFVKEVLNETETMSKGDKASWSMLNSQIVLSKNLFNKIKRIEKKDIEEVNKDIASIRRAIKRLQSKGYKNNIQIEHEINQLNSKLRNQEKIYLGIENKLNGLYEELRRIKAVIETAQGEEKTIFVGDIIRIYKPNEMSFLAKAIIYIEKVWEFIFSKPRESNTEGGVFPAIFGTFLMVIIMSIVVLPFGVLTAVYLTEYAKHGAFVGIVRVCINNLAGVPSIVYGVFGLAFFVYGFGGTIDRLFYSEILPTPTYGTGGILWSSLTLALLTLPVVIVSTEEGLNAVPQEVRHGALALGANKFETLTRIILPGATPGILTGLILAIARAAGEVAPLMITGVVKLAPSLPVDGTFPFLHFDRKFMHLGFYIYDAGFQSPNVEASKPIVFAATLLLILIVIILNLTAVLIRNYLRKRLFSTAF